MVTSGHISSIPSAYFTLSWWHFPPQTFHGHLGSWISRSEHVLEIPGLASVERRDCSFPGRPGVSAVVSHSFCAWSMRNLRVGHEGELGGGGGGELLKLAIIQLTSWRKRIDCPGNLIFPSIIANVILIHSKVIAPKFYGVHCVQRCHLQMQMWWMLCVWPWHNS
jgi:hypothetical protein